MLLLEIAEFQTASWKMTLAVHEDHYSKVSQEASRSGCLSSGTGLSPNLLPRFAVQSASPKDSLFETFSSSCGVSHLHCGPSLSTFLPGFKDWGRQQTDSSPRPISLFVITSHLGQAENVSF